MEQKIIEQIDKAIEILREKAKNVNERYSTLKKELYTPEIKEMIASIWQYGHICMHLDTSSEHYERIYFVRNYVGSKDLNIDLYPSVGGENNCPAFNYTIYSEAEYNENFISSMEMYVKEIKKCEEMVSFLEEHATELIEYITKKYREVCENQTHRISNILSELNYENEPIKHIKVTVEWL